MSTFRFTEHSSDEQRYDHAVGDESCHECWRQMEALHAQERARIAELEAAVARVRAVVERHRGGSHEPQSPLVYEIDVALTGPPKGGK
jgi:hypothetical protein